MTETTLAGAAAPEAARWPVAGHDWIVEQLAHTLADASSGGPRHAYLFVGPRQIGKSTLVRAFAAALLCTGAAPRPCGACRSCRLMAAGSHPDFHLVQPLDKHPDKDGRPDRSGKLYAEQADEVIHASALRPVEGRYRVFHIQDVHLAAAATFPNKLLKTLEEPPAHVVLCLSALDRSGLLPTVVSRCQVFDLRPVAPPAIEQLLIERHKADPEQARLLARLANGRPGWAVEQSARKDAWRALRAEQIATLRRLMSANRAERLAYSESLAANRNNAQLFNMLELWSAWWRDLLLAQAGYPEAICNVDFQPVLAQQAAALPPRQVQDYLAMLKRTEGYLRHTVNARLALDVLLLRLPQLAGGAETR